MNNVSEKYDTKTVFRSFLNLSKDQVKNLSTETWLAFYDIADVLCKETRCSPQALIEKYPDVFLHMYSNYRQPKDISLKIKQLAYEVADSLTTSNEFAQLYYDIDTLCCVTESKKAARILRKYVYKEVFGNEIIANLLKPKLKIEKTDNMINNGSFNKGDSFDLPKVRLRKGGTNFCNTAAHELFHSLQCLNNSHRIKFLKKMGISFPYDKNMGKLYNANSDYYISTNDEKGYIYQGYRKQPLEYGARFFATCFERRLRKNLRANEKNWNLMFQTTQILRKLDINEQVSKYSPKEVYIHIDVKSKKDEFILREFKSVYVKKGTMWPVGCLTIDRDVQNAISISNLYKKICEAEQTNTQKDLIKKFFPITYNALYASEKEKSQQIPVLGKITINRSR